MGCDIHLFIETKEGKNWQTHSNPSIGRSYRLFSLMADVRNRFDIEPLVERKGLPDDVTEEVRLESEEFWGCDGHSHSWLSKDEIKTLKERCIEEDIIYFADFIDIVDKELEDKEDYRFIFWFDN